LRHIARLVFQVEDDAVGDALMELVRVDIRTEDVPRQLLVFTQ